MEMPAKTIVRFDGENGDGIVSIAETFEEIILLITGRDDQSTKGSFFKDKSPECCRILRELGRAMKKEGGIEISKESFLKFVTSITE